jgi:hypothetical protein
MLSVTPTNHNHPPPTTHHQLLYTRLEKKVRITTQKLYMFS